MFPTFCLMQVLGVICLICVLIYVVGLAIQSGLRIQAIQNTWITSHFHMGLLG